MTGEVREPARDLPRAIFFSIGITTLLYGLGFLAVVVWATPTTKASRHSMLLSVGKHQSFWLTRERLLMLVLAGASVVVGWLCWRLVKPFVPAITWALVLTVLAHPLHERLLVMFEKWPSVSAALAVVAVTLAIALPATLLVRQMGSEAVSSIETARKVLDTDRWKLAIERFPQLAKVRKWIEREG